MKVNQYQRVKDLLHKYTIIQPTNAQVFCLMAETLQQTNDTENAKSWLVKKRKRSGRIYKKFNTFNSLLFSKSMEITELKVLSGLAMQ